MNSSVAAQVLGGHRQGEHDGVEPAAVQLVEQRVGLVLDEQHLEVGEPGPQRRHDVGQQVRPERREQCRGGSSPTAASRALGGDRPDPLGLVEHHARRLDHLAAGLGEHHVARAALDQLDAELLLQLLQLRRQGRLADEARLGGPAEVAVVGHRHEVAQVSQVHRSPPAAPRPGRARRRRCDATRPRRQRGPRRAALVRIRWSNALSAAVEPAPRATTICLYGSVVQSPAANTPGTEVSPRSSTTISPRPVRRSTAPASHSVFGSRPICTKMPSSVDQVRRRRSSGRCSAGR